MMKIVTDGQLGELIKQLKREGQKIVFTNGCFDILHVGHVRYLAAAKALGNCLIVGLNSDRSVKNIKGPTRPINREQDRAEVLSAMAAVDYVVIFDDNTAERLVELVKPDLYVKGGDYEIKDLPEARLVAQYGGKTVLIPEVKGRSSTTIINKIAEMKQQ